MKDRPRGSVNVDALGKAARLLRALEGLPAGARVLQREKDSKGRPRGLELSVGHMEQLGSEYELVQPDDYAGVVDHATGRLILLAAQRIIREELRKLGVTVS